MNSSLETLLQEVSKQVDRGAKLKIIVPEDTGMFKLDKDLVHNTKQMIDETTKVLLDVTDTFEQSPPAAGASTTLSPQEVADLAFVCRSELKELAKEFDAAVTDGSLWKIAAANDQVVSRAVRALIPIESTLREYAGLTSLHRQWFDLDDALEIRQQFANIWIELRKDGEPTADSVDELLTRITRMIAVLRRDPIYPYLRIDDRLEIRAIQKRIFAYLEDTSATPGVEGIRLFQDAGGFFDLLMHSHRREELVENDRFLIDSIFRDVFEYGEAPEIMPEDSFDDLRSFVAMDPELDVLLLKGEPSAAELFREPLKRIREQLKKH